MRVEEAEYAAWWPLAAMLEDAGRRADRCAAAGAVAAVPEPGPLGRWADAPGLWPKAVCHRQEVRFKAALVWILFTMD